MSAAPSNFSFLQAGWPELFAEASRAENALAADPRAACFYARRTLELGLDREAATQALSGFAVGKTLSGNQLEFVALIVSRLTERGVMDAALLYEPPFTNLAPKGPDALFTSAQVDELFGVLEQVKASARAA